MHGACMMASYAAYAIRQNCKILKLYTASERANSTIAHASKKYNYINKDVRSLHGYAGNFIWIGLADSNDWFV